MSMTRNDPGFSSWMAFMEEDWDQGPIASTPIGQLK
jgi:hypothetical protein